MRRLRTPFRRHVLLGLALALAASVAAAAGPLVPAKPAATEPAKSAVEPLAFGDIPTRADTDERFIQDVIRRSQQKDPSAKLVPQLEAMTVSIAKLSQVFSRQEMQELAAMRLENLMKHWNFYARELADWRRDLQRVSSPYAEDATELAARRVVWEATQSAMGSSGAASALSDRVSNILAQIAQADRALSGPLNRQIELGRQANLVQANIDAGRKSIASAIAYHDRRLSMIDSTPLWEAWGDPRFTQVELAGAVAGLRPELDFLREWGEFNASRVRWYGTGALLLLPFLVWLTRRSRKVIASDAEMRAAAQVLLRPVSAWLVLVLVGILFLFPDAPLILPFVALLLALIPVLRLLPPEIFAVLGAWPYIATALFLLYRLSFLLLAQALYFRLYLMAVAVLTVVALAWLLLTAKRGGTPNPLDRTRPIVRILGWAAVAALLVAIVANLIGNVSLAEMLCGAVLYSAYLGLVLYAGANLLVSMIRLLLARRVMTQFRVLTQHAGPLLESVNKLLMLAALVAWLVITLNEFRIARPVFGALKSVLGYPLEMGELSVTAGSILLFAFSLWIAYWVARTARLVLQDDVLPKMALPRGVGNSISTLTYYALIMAGIFVALAAAGFRLSQLALVVGALSVGIGFGLQTVVNNFVSGLILMFERPIQPGDVVEVSGTQGTIREIGMRATTLATFDGADVVVPNGTLLSEKLINWTLSNTSRRIEVNVGVAYGSNPRQVMQLMLDVAKSTPGVAAQPEPSAVFAGFGPNSLDFGIRAWTHNFADWVNIRSEIAMRLYDALAAADIPIPFPQRDLHLRSVSAQARGELAAAIKPGDPPAA